MNQHYITIRCDHAGKVPLLLLLTKLGIRQARPQFAHPVMDNIFNSLVLGKWLCVGMITEDIVKYRSLNA
jgi:hypothetical protein